MNYAGYHETCNDSTEYTIWFMPMYMSNVTSSFIPMSGLAIPMNGEKQNVTTGAGSIALCVFWQYYGEQTIYIKKNTVDIVDGCYFSEEKKYFY
jgi:hypothetical protein